MGGGRVAECAQSSSWPLKNHDFVRDILQKRALGQFLDANLNHWVLSVQNGSNIPPRRLQETPEPVQKLSSSPLNAPDTREIALKSLKTLFSRRKGVGEMA